MTAVARRLSLPPPIVCFGTADPLLGRKSAASAFAKLSDSCTLKISKNGMPPPSGLRHKLHTDHWRRSLLAFEEGKEAVAEVEGLRALPKSRTNEVENVGRGRMVRADARGSGQIAEADRRSVRK